MTESFNILVNKLNSFKLKYYSYKLIKGLILSVFSLLVIYTLFSTVEYFVYFSSEIRKVFFYGYLIFAGLLFVQFLFFPLFKLLHILKPLSINSISEIIQNHFTEIKDKLLNIIELSSISEEQYSNEIVIASIDQKINELKIFDFNEAVPFKNLRIILFFFLIGLFTSIGIFLINRNIFTESTNRLLHYNEAFVKPAPFSFIIENENLQATKGDSFTLKVRCVGDEIPQIIYINIDGNNYLMKSLQKGTFEFNMASVINPVHFYLTDLKYNSKKFTLQLLPKPGIVTFKTAIYPPAYTNLQNLLFDNIGDLQVPNGTRVNWTFTGIDVDSLKLQLIKDSTVLIANYLDKKFHVETQFYKTTGYNVYVQNNLTQPELALSYSVDVVPDLFPEIEIEQKQDSIKLTRFFFKGTIGDDYGFSNLQFHFNVQNNDSAINIPFVKLLTNEDFFFSFDFGDLKLPSGAISYYFSVTDNDVINGYKTTTSKSFLFEIPSSEELARTDKEQFNKLQNMLKKSSEMVRDIKSDLNKLQIKNMDTNVSEWEKMQMVNDIISKQNKLEKLYDQIKKNNENLNNYLNSFDKQNDEIVKKQKQIEDLLNEVFTDELKQLLEEFNKLADKFDGKKLNQLTKQLDLTFDDLKKQLDRNLEMLRKMKIKQKLQDIIDSINQLALKENKLAEDVIEKKNKEKILNKVKKHQQNLLEQQQELIGTLELNNKLEKSLIFDDFDEDFRDINKSFEESKILLNKKNKKKSSVKFKGTSEKLSNLGFAMQQMLNMNTTKENTESIADLKQLLSNLIVLSFEQEDVLNKLNGVNSSDPLLVQLNQQQKRIVDQSKVVKDSLYALAMRTPSITSMVNNELLTLQINIEKATTQLEEALFSNARVNQQFVITSINNLALMLNDALENLEKQMANAQPGDQECEKPGNGKPGMNMLKKASENIKQQLQKMIEEMKKGNPREMSRQLGQSLMQHEIMQQMLREMMNGESVGSRAKKQLQQIDRLLEQNRKELMNKRINAQTIARQNLISTRLLEAENAEMEREYEQKRESKSAEDFYSNPIKYFEYKEKENYSIEYFNKQSHQLNNFYNNKYKKYLSNIQENKQ